MEENSIEENESVTLSDSAIKTLEEVIENGEKETIESTISDLTIPECAELLEKVNDENRQVILEQHGGAIDPEVFTELDPELCHTTLSKMEVPEVVAIITELDIDDAIEVIENLTPALQQNVIQELPEEVKITVEEGLSYPEDSAGRLMERQFVAVPFSWKVGKTIRYIQEAPDKDIPKSFNDIILVTPNLEVKGMVPLSLLLRSKNQEPLESISQEVHYPITTSMDQEEVAELFRRENLSSAPVVDDDNKLTGVITIDDVVDVIDEEANEDILKLAGVDEGSIYRNAWSIGLSRFRWLFINLLTAILASVIISFFDATIQQVVALAILMPIVASMGGNAGTQTLTVAVRALAMHDVSNVNSWRVIMKETLAGMLNGILFAIIIGVICFFWFGDPDLALIIAAAMVINLVVAGLFGAGIPILLDRMGSDPAVSSTVLLTTVTDAVGFFIFLGLATVFLL